MASEEVLTGSAEEGHRPPSVASRLALATVSPRLRLWVESLTALVALGLSVLTLLWHDWIEAIFGVDPDRHSGTVEWAVAGGLFVLSVVLGVLASRVRRRAHGPGGERARGLDETPWSHRSTRELR